MVDGQVRPSDVTDRRIIRAMLAVPREAFVPEDKKDVAYFDGDIPLGPAGRALLAPRTLAKLMQLAAPGDHDTTMVVASGTGYAAAVLAQFSDRVVALESDADLHATASRRVQEAGPANLVCVHGPLAQGDAEGGPYDVILVAGAVNDVPDELLGQLKDGGRLVAILKPGGAAPGRATLWRRSGRQFGQAASFDATAPLLQEFENKVDFAL